MTTRTGTDIIAGWPEGSREVAQLVIDKCGEPHESTSSQLTWHEVGPWKRMVATRAFFEHQFPAPHIDAVESFLDYRAPTEKFSALAEFDGSVIVERTAGEVSARCHDEEANFLALNLMHDVATGAKTSDETREYYAKELLDYRRKQPTPYTDGLRFTPNDGNAAESDQRVPSAEDLEQAQQEGKPSAG